MNGFDSVTLLPIGSNQTRVGGGGGVEDKIMVAGRNVGFCSA